jgi:predicted transcriptional regulator
MKPIDYRNETWEEIQGRLTGQRERVYRALLRVGPSTTEDLAAQIPMSILSVRPRITELYQIGLVALVVNDPTRKTRGAREGVYRAIPVERARSDFEASRLAESGRQAVQQELAFRASGQAQGGSTQGRALQSAERNGELGRRWTPMNTDEAAEKDQHGPTRQDAPETAGGFGAPVARDFPGDAPRGACGLLRGVSEVAAGGA